MSESERARLSGGPADSFYIRLPGDDLEWVAHTMNDYGKPVPYVIDGCAVTLPNDFGPEVEALLNAPRRHWERYRKVGTRPAGVAVDPRDDLPMPPDGTVVYRWMRERRT